MKKIIKVLLFINLPGLCYCSSLVQDPIIEQSLKEHFEYAMVENLNQLIKLKNDLQNCMNIYRNKNIKNNIVEILSGMGILVLSSILTLVTTKLAYTYCNGGDGDAFLIMLPITSLLISGLGVHKIRIGWNYFEKLFIEIEDKIHQVNNNVSILENYINKAN